MSPIFWLGPLVPTFFSGYWVGAWSMRRYYVERIAFERKLRAAHYLHDERAERVLDLSTPEAREITKEWKS